MGESAIALSALWLSIIRIGSTPFVRRVKRESENNGLPLWPVAPWGMFVCAMLNWALSIVKLLAFVKTPAMSQTAKIEVVFVMVMVVVVKRE
jgi:ABC-type Co2+ transport system permease subunit